MIRSLTVLLLCGAGLGAQMELRAFSLFEHEVFRTTAPAVGAPCPHLVLKDLDGKPRSLSEARGRHLLLIKGSFT